MKELTLPQLRATWRGIYANGKPPAATTTAASTAPGCAGSPSAYARRKEKLRIMPNLASLILTPRPGNGFGADVLDEHNRSIAIVNMWSEEQTNALAHLFAASPKMLIACQAAYELLLGMPALANGHTAQLLHRALTAARQNLTP